MTPFWMLVACQLVNRASWEVAEGVLSRVRAKWPEPSALEFADADALARVLRPIGLQNGRARNLIAFARAWRLTRPATRDDVLSMPGCGPYAADAWAIFIEGRRDVDPTDGKLNWYLMCEGRLV